MKEMYHYASPTGHEKEVIILQSSSGEQTAEHIAQITGIYGAPFREWLKYSKGTVYGVWE